ncbi:MAG: polysaccharide biosynthesis tyrosine autokinase [Lachnospiraceae bacterium]|nr:polysaccharide biosynthesis tyrosine autokinase [Lachnospiraceae bacterium]
MSETQAGIEPEKIDIVSFLSDMLHRLKRFWWVILLLTLLFGELFYFRSTVSYSPTYAADATVTVEMINGGSTSNENTTELISSVFPHLLSTGILSDAIKSDLAIKSIPAVIRVSSIKGTNLLTITVTGADPNSSYEILQSTVRNLPRAVQYVVGQTKMTIIDESGIPEDSGKTTVVRGSLVKGLLLGFVIGVALLVAYTLATRTIRTEKELKKLFNVPFLGNIPFSRKKSRKGEERAPVSILAGTAGPGYEEGIRTVRTRVERSLGDGKVLMVTSSLPGEGKSTMAANLAVALARKGKRVILADCDLRNPSQQEFFELEGEFPGLEEVLRGRVPLKDALTQVSHEGKELSLFVLPGKSRGIESVEILGRDVMEKVLGELKGLADIVILDTPPSAMLMDASLLAGMTDGVLYVVLSDYAKRRVIQHGLRELQQNGAMILGCVLNGGKQARSGRYGYGYGYGSREKS